MYQSGDAAEQIVRVSIEGVEMAAKLAGSGAKELATFLFAVLRDSGQERQQKGPVLRGRERLGDMLKSGKELKVFALKEADLKAFCAEAKSFGVGYYVVRHKNKKLDGLCDVMVPAEQASIVARIVEGFGYLPTDRATLRAEVERERGVQTRDATDILLDEVLAAPQQRDKPVAAGPTAARTDGTNTLSAPGSQPNLSSGSPSNTAKSKKPLVKDRLAAIVAGMQRKPPTAAPQHQQSKPPRKRKSKGAKTHAEL